MSYPSFPSYRSRYLPAMTRAKIAALPDREWAPVIVPVGAIEQHGPHLPVAVDAYLAQVWIERLLPLLPADASCYFAPAITMGKSNEHTGFPGTLTISKETLRLQLLSIGRQISQWGFRQMAVLNTHGGNLAVLGYTLRELAASYGLRTGLLQSGVSAEVSLQEATFGFHANEVETSLMLVSAGSLVRMARAVCEYPMQAGETNELRPERAPVTFAWVAQDFGRSGIMGDAPAASVEKGERWLAQTSAGYAQAVARIGAEGRARLMATP